MENVDKTIDVICTWIQEEMKSAGKSNVLPEMITALASLVSARAESKSVISFQSPNCNPDNLVIKNVKKVKAKHFI